MKIYTDSGLTIGSTLYYSNGKKTREYLVVSVHHDPKNVRYPYVYQCQPTGNEWGSELEDCDECE